MVVGTFDKLGLPQSKLIVLCTPLLCNILGRVMFPAVLTPSSITVIAYGACAFRIAKCGLFVAFIPMLDADPSLKSKLLHFGDLYIVLETYVTTALDAQSVIQHRHL